MNKKSWQLPRRTFLRGLGATIALPMLDAMLPLRALAAGSPAAATPPLRMAFLFVPNGAHMPDWTPQQDGADFELPSILNPLNPFKQDLLVLTGLTHDKGRGNGDGPGDHARSAGVFLTGVQPLKSEGAEIRAGVSVDQFAAGVVGRNTRFPSLELGTEPGRAAGKCDSGYSCAYSNNISWRDETTPMAKEDNPRQVFERLFANELPSQSDKDRAKRQRYNKSILDFVLEDANRLSSKVGGADKQKLNEYLSAIREIELRIERTENEDTEQLGFLADYEMPADNPASYEERLKLMGDMMVLAFQADVTRISTFMLANEGSNRSYRSIGVSDGHHTLSHHGNNPEKTSQISKINHYHVEQFAYILQKLKSIPEASGSLLDNCMIVYGAGISDGNRHNNENLPIVIAGRGGGTLLPGRHVRYQYETPVCNLFVSMLNRFGAPTDTFGDSTGHLRGLEG